MFSVIWEAIRDIVNLAPYIKKVLGFFVGLLYQKLEESPPPEPPASREPITLPLPPIEMRMPKDSLVEVSKPSVGLLSQPKTFVSLTMEGLGEVDIEVKSIEVKKKPKASVIVEIKEFAQEKLARVMLERPVAKKPEIIPIPQKIAMAASEEDQDSVILGSYKQNHRMHSSPGIRSKFY